MKMVERIKEKLIIILLIILVIPTFSSVLRFGYFPMHDDMQAMRLLQMDKCIKDGQIPCRWVPDMGFGYGYPQFNYYAPFPYYVMEIFYLAGFGYLDSVKAGFVLSTLISMVGMYLLGKHFWGRAGGFISSFLYIYAPYRAVNFYVRGAMGELWAMAVIPFIFLYSVKVFNNEKRAKYYLALSLAALFTSHNISTLIFLPVLFVWWIFLFLYKGNFSPVKLKKKISSLFISFSLSFAISSFFILPAWFERSLVHIETLLGGYFNYINHFVGIKQLLFETHWGYGTSEVGPYDDILLSIGLVHWILPLLASILLFIIKKKKKAVLATFLILLGWISLFMAHPKSSFIWDFTGLLAFIQFPWRFLIIATFLFCLASGSLALILKTVGNGKLFYLLFVAIVFMLYRSYFMPRIWLNIDDKGKFSGDEWQRQQTISIFDYLPIYAERPPAKAAPDHPTVLGGEAQFVSGDFGTNWQRWQIDTKSPQATIQLPVFYFPEWRVFIDDEQTPISYSNELGLITFSVPQSTHEIRVQLADTPIRRFANFISLVGIVGIPILLMKEKQR